VPDALGPQGLFALLFPAQVETQRLPRPTKLAVVGGNSHLFHS
jgi:hypothetical protein